MLAFMIISVVCFFALFFAVIALLRRAAKHGVARAVSAQRQTPALRSIPLDLPAESYASTSSPGLPSKRPDWRFLVRHGKHPHLDLPGRLPDAAPSDVAPIAPIESGRMRSDWAFYNKDLGDLNDPYRAAPPTARRA